MPKCEMVNGFWRGFAALSIHAAPKGGKTRQAFEDLVADVISLTRPTSRNYIIFASALLLIAVYLFIRINIRDHTISNIC